MKYLIISTNAIGDTYLSTSSIRVIKSNDKDAEIDFIISTKSQSILEFLSLDNIYTVRKNCFDLFTTAFRVRKQKYDYVFSFFPGLVNTFFFLISKGSKKGGYVNFIRRNEWYGKKQKVVIKGTNQKKLFWLPEDKYLDRIKIPLSVFFDLSINDCFQKKILEIITLKSNYSDSILIHPFSRSKERALGHESLKMLVKHFEKHDKVFVIGQANDFLNFSDSTIPRLQDLTFKELAEAILSCKLFIAVDSFPIHIADAHNTNFIGLFGPTNPKAVLENHSNAIRFNTNRLDNLSFGTLVNELDVSINKKMKT